MTILKVKSDSDPKLVAGAIAKQFEEGSEQVIIHAIGAAAVNQVVKSIAVARGYVAPKGFNLAEIPGFVPININGEERTGIKFTVIKI